MTKSYYFLFFVLILLNSCGSDINAKFEITNRTNASIDSINIKSFDHSPNGNFINLQAGESKTYWLNMTNLPKMDGDYLLSYRLNRTITKNQRFGYFTNGYPLEKMTIIEFQKDTVVIDQVLDDY